MTAWRKTQRSMLAVGIDSVGRLTRCGGDDPLRAKVWKRKYKHAQQVQAEIDSLCDRGQVQAPRLVALQRICNETHADTRRPNFDLS